MRAFIALDLPAPLKDALSRIQTELKKCPCDLRWVPVNQSHLTLRFIGDIADDQIPSIWQDVQETSAHQKRFTTNLSHLGVFPSWTKARVLWAGIVDREEKMVSLARTLERILVKYNISQEQKIFKPHITLARINHLTRIQVLKDKIDHISFPEDDFILNTLTLYQSTLTPDGAIHKALFQQSLHD